MSNRKQPFGYNGKIRATWQILKGGKATSVPSSEETTPVDIVNPLLDAFAIVEHIQQHTKLKFKAGFFIGIDDNDKVILLHDQTIISDSDVLKYLSQAEWIANDYLQNGGDEVELSD